MRTVLSATAFSAILVAGLGFSTAAMAQSPSVLQTIEALKPRPGKSRGSRPVVAPPASDAGTAAPVAVATPAPAAHAPAAAAPRPTMASAAPAAKPVAADADAPSLDISILFANGSAELTPSAIKSLDTLGQALASPDLAASQFRIEGHTDSVGSKDDNRALSARRAAAVVDYLTHKYRIAPTRLQSVGKGEDDLLVPTGDEVPEPRNRRVRVVNITG